MNATIFTALEKLFSDARAAVADNLADQLGDIIAEERWQQG